MPERPWPRGLMPSPAYIAVDMGVGLDEVMKWIETGELPVVRVEIIRVRVDVYEKFRARRLTAKENG